MTHGWLRKEIQALSGLLDMREREILRHRFYEKA